MYENLKKKQYLREAYRPKAANPTANPIGNK